jgi:hypothetical protein
MPCAHRREHLDTVFVHIITILNSYPPRTSHNSLSGFMSGGITLVFDTRSSWGHPKTLALKVSRLSKCSGGPVEESNDLSDLGCGFVDLCPMWNMKCCENVELKTKIYHFDSAEEFDQHGETADKSAQGDEVRYVASSLFFAFCFALSVANAYR